MTAAVALPASAGERPVSPWLAIAAGAIGAFMALLDTSIANAALPVIQGEIGATPSEGTWVGTAYLATEVVIIPLIAWLERLCGMRRLLIFAASAFTVFSVVCGMATDLTTMIVGRLGQGLSGGVLIPSAYSLVAKRLPPEEQSKGIAIVSMPILLAPVVGPLLGGWLTENYSWHYAFFINVPICLGLLVLLMIGVPSEKGDLRELPNADWYGIAGMVLGLGGLTVMLEEGHREQWFQSPLIWRLAGITLLGFLLVAVGQFRSPKPVLRLALMGNGVLGPATALQLASGIMMFCALFALPQFLLLIAGYNAFQAGQVLLFGGLTSFLVMFVYPLVMKVSPIRLTVFLAMLTQAAFCYLCAGLSADTGASAFVVPLILFGLGISMMAVPLQETALRSVGASEASEVSSLIACSRNVGGSIGLAALASFQDQRLAFHQGRLHETIGANDPGAWERLDGFAAQFGGGPDGLQAAYRMLDSLVSREALIMTFNDIFLVLAIGILLIAPLGLLLPARQGGDGAATVAAH